MKLSILAVTVLAGMGCRSEQDMEDCGEKLLGSAEAISCFADGGAFSYNAKTCVVIGCEKKPLSPAREGDDGR